MTVDQHLEEAQQYIDKATENAQSPYWAPVYAQVAIAHALLAVAEEVTRAIETSWGQR